MSFWKTICFAALCSFFVSTLLHAESDLGTNDLKSAQKFFAAKDYANALKLLKSSFEKGDPRASALLGYFYQQGLGVPKDPSEAVRWYQISVDHGYKDAEFNLAILYETGDGVPKDSKKAFDLFRKAADQGLASADIQMGSYYENGRVVLKNTDEAIKWYIKGIQEKLPDDNFDLQEIYLTIANLYFEKNGSEQDYHEAQKWYQKASELQIQNAEKKTDPTSKTGK